MNAREIVVHEIDCHHARVVRRLLAECIREPRHAPIAHADRKIAAFYERSRNVLGIGLSFDAMIARSRANGLTVAALSFGGLAVRGRLSRLGTGTV
jgi:hypothetical protein